MLTQSLWHSAEQKASAEENTNSSLWTLAYEYHMMDNPYPSVAGSSWFMPGPGAVMASSQVLQFR